MLYGSRATLASWLAPIGIAFAGIVSAAFAFAPVLAPLLQAPAVLAVDRAGWQFSRLLPGGFWASFLWGVSDLHGTVGILVLATGCAVLWMHAGRPDAVMRLVASVP